MSPFPRRETATIYQFPVKIRPTALAGRADPRRAADPWLPPLVASDFGSGWYHEAAMQESDLQESDLGRKH